MSVESFNIPPDMKKRVRAKIADYKRTMPDEVARLHSNRAEIATELHRRWRAALDHYDLAVVTAYRAGAEFNDRHRPEAIRRNDLVFEVLARLHSQSCRISSEVRALLHGGHAEGATARSRTMHELAVLSHFIGEHDEATAERFLFHERVEQYRLAEEYNRSAAALGEEGIPDADFQALKTEYDRLVQLHGDGFAGDYGWAGEAIIPGNRKHRPSFKEVEQAVKLSSSRPFYQIASKHIHAGSLSSTAHIIMAGSRQVFATGPSYTGLAQPANATLLGLLQCTFAFLRLGPDHYDDDEPLVTLHALAALTEEIAGIFSATERALEEQRAGSS